LPFPACTARLAHQTYGVDIEQQRGGASLAAHFRIENMSGSEGQLERLSTVRALVEQKSKVCGRRIRVGDRQEHSLRVDRPSVIPPSVVQRSSSQDCFMPAHIKMVPSLQPSPALMSIPSHLEASLAALAMIASPATKTLTIATVSLDYFSRVTDEVGEDLVSRRGRWARTRPFPD
jgi:hypothetical protein